MFFKVRNSLRPLTVAASLALLATMTGCATPEALVIEPPIQVASEPDYVEVPVDAVPEPELIAPPVVEPVPEPVNISFSFVGDMTYGNKGNVPPGGVGAILDYVRDELVGADITMGNLETAIGTGPATKCANTPENCYAFQAVPETGAALAEAGFDVVSVANNHSNDAGPAGVASTQAALTEAGVAWTGQRDQITYLDRDGVTIAFLGYAPYDSVANALDLPKVIEMVTEAEENADLVVVMPHLGAEGDDKQHVKPGVEIAYGENRGDSMAFARAVIDAGADLVIGSGPHVLRGMEWYNGKLIAYSLGNFSGYHTLAMGGIKGVSGILDVTLNSDGEFVSGRLVPLVVDKVGTPKVDSQGRAIGMVTSLSTQDFGENGVALTDAGEIVPPAVG